MKSLVDKHSECHYHRKHTQLRTTVIHPLQITQFDLYCRTSNLM